jgi:hypothetical protein
MPASPSLLIVPARFKTGKLYTQIATTSAGVVLGSSGDFNVTRATTATRFNSAGLIESVASGVPRLDYYTSGGTAGCPALLVEASGSNLCLQSQDFTTTWSPTNVTVSANVTGTTDPFGTFLAEQLFETTTSGIHILSQTMSITSGTTYAGSIFYKKAAGSPDWMQLAYSTTGLAGFANFNLTSGTVGNVGAGCTGRIENYGNGWYRCTLVQTANASGTSGGPIPVFVNNTNSVTRFLTYAGNASTSIFIFGAQLETGSFATSYIPTTAAAVTRNADVVTLSGEVSGCIGQTEGTLYAEIVAQPYNNSSFPAILQVDDGADSQRFAIFIHASGGIRVRLNASGINLGIDSTNPATLVVGQTYKIAAAFGFNGSQALYINGVFQVSGSVTAGPFTAALNRVMLGHRGGIVSPFLIRSAALYTTRLTNAELAALTTL